MVVKTRDSFDTSATLNFFSPPSSLQQPTTPKANTVTAASAATAVIFLRIEFLTHHTCTLGHYR
ncbi:hypothetical protein HMPREF9997_02061 [Corynebacterium durum F0235]|uniref:Uncharacterized protein n=1 Tax=Corynebacterium durum F0235 TaxID=1035195 RepID=L1MCI3_9CORY|nr:hypothetical protein HMPREF9997_02061 [Corynebacterium durum F0235]